MLSSLLINFSRTKENPLGPKEILLVTFFIPRLRTVAWQMNGWRHLKSARYPVNVRSKLQMQHGGHRWSQSHLVGSFSELRNSEIKSVLGLKEALMCRFEKRWRRNSGQFREGLISVYLQCLPCSNNNSKMSFGTVLHCRALIEHFVISERRELEE